MLQLRIRLNRLEEHKDKLRFPYWIDGLLRPVIGQINEQLSGWQWNKGSLTPLGIGTRVTVFFNKDKFPRNTDKHSYCNYIYMVFLPGELSKGQLLYETGETATRFAPGTIGAMNGFNKMTKPLETIEEAVHFLKKQAGQKQR